MPGLVPGDSAGRSMEPAYVPCGPAAPIGETLADGVDTPGVQMSSCGLVEGGSVGPGGVFVVGGLVFEASVEDTYESVG